MYGVNLEEAAYSLEHYNSLCEFFIRPLKEGSRPVAEYEPLVSIKKRRKTSFGIQKKKKKWSYSIFLTFSSS